MSAIHVAFGDCAAANIKAALKIHNKHPELKNRSPFTQEAVVLPCPDLYALGPVMDMDLPSGFFDRINWLGLFLETCLEPDKSFDDVDDMLEKISDFYKKLAWIENDQILVLWHGDNVIDQIGIRLMADLLPNCALHEVKLKDAHTLCNYPDEIPRTVAECKPELISCLFDNIRPVAPEVKVKWDADWKELTQTMGTLRIWNQDLIETVSENYFDEALIRNCEEGFRPAAWVIADVLAEGVCEACQEFLALRLKNLVLEGVLKCEGTLESYKTYQVAK